MIRRLGSLLLQKFEILRQGVPAGPRRSRVDVEIELPNNTNTFQTVDVEAEIRVEVEGSPWAAFLFAPDGALWQTGSGLRLAFEGDKIGRVLGKGVERWFFAIRLTAMRKLRRLVLL